MSHHVVIEWAPFAVKPGVEDAELVAASEALQNGFLSHQRGFIRRELLKGQNGQWVDLAVWDSKDAADQAVRNAAENPACFQYFQLMVNADHDDPGAGVLHFERIRGYERQGDREADGTA
jgi:heme-degrading monooxygenase HmoA